MNAVATFTNNGVQANVFANTSKAGHFNVVLKDLDSGESLPTVKVYPTLEGAVAYAKSLVG